LDSVEGTRSMEPSVTSPPSFLHGGMNPLSSSCDFLTAFLYDHLLENEVQLYAILSLNSGEFFVRRFLAFPIHAALLCWSFKPFDGFP